MSWIRGLCTKNDINQKSWAHLIEPRWLRSRFIGTWKFRISFLCHFKVKRVFTAPSRTTNTSNNSRSITYHKNNVQIPLEHSQSLHFTNIGQFFMCLNCIPPIKFTSPRAQVLFTIYDSFPQESSQCIINFWFSWECHAMIKISVWSWNKKWVTCILSRSSEHLWWQREIFLRSPSPARSVASKLSRAKFQRNEKSNLSTPFVLSHLLRNSSKYLRSCKILQIEQVLKD